MNLQTLNDKKLFVLDMDGTIYLGDKLFPWTLDFLQRVKHNNQQYIFFTNNSSKHRDAYLEKLSKMGITDCRVVTSGDVTIDYLKREYNSKKVFLLGTRYLRESFAQAGIVLTDDVPDVTVVGFDTELCYERLSKACHYIRNSSPFIATHLDLNCPTEDGFIPDCGAICALITASTSKQPKYLGKPFPETVDAIINVTGFKKDEIVFVGDRLYTDIAIGKNNGITSVLVLSGETTVADLELSDIKPDFVVNSLKDLL